jgi:phosphoglycolate phosphatase-like HAD superfamily hydrolase
LSLKAVVLDFDGVILQSVAVKTGAFGRLFDNEKPEHREAIVAYHLKNGGISRFEKFRWAYREVLRRPLSPDEEKELGSRFNRLVEDGVVAAAWVPGASEFLKACHKTWPLFVASGTPQDEMRRIVERRGIGGYFRKVFGSPTKKAEILRGIAKDVGCALSELVMVGDASNDFEAARETGVPFIGIVLKGEASPFASDVRVLPDLTGLQAALFKVE